MSIDIYSISFSSISAASSIMTLISDIQNAVVGIVEASKGSSQSFSQLGEKITVLDHSLHEVRAGMDEQNRGAQDIMEMMKILNSVASALAESSQQMKDETQTVAHNIAQLRDASHDILDRGSRTSGQLSQMSNYAQVASQESMENVRLVGEVHKLISSFKVD